MKLYLAALLSIVVALDSYAVVIDPSVYFAYRKGVAGSHIFLSKRPCHLLKHENIVNSFKERILREGVDTYCASGGGGELCSWSRSTFNTGWKLAQITDPQDIQPSEGCWKEIKYQNMNRILLCNLDRFGTHCGVERKEFYLGTDSLPVAPAPPKSAIFEK